MERCIYITDFFGNRIRQKEFIFIFEKAADENNYKLEGLYKKVAKRLSKKLYRPSFIYFIGLEKAVENEYLHLYTNDKLPLYSVKY